MSGNVRRLAHDYQVRSAPIHATAPSGEALCRDGRRIRADNRESTTDAVTCPFCLMIRGDRLPLWPSPRSYVTRGLRHAFIRTAS